MPQIPETKMSLICPLFPRSVGFRPSRASEFPHKLCEDKNIGASVPRNADSAGLFMALDAQVLSPAAVNRAGKPVSAGVDGVFP